MHTDLKQGDYVSVRCTRNDLFYWMKSPGFDGVVMAVDDQTGQMVKLRVETEPRPSRFEKHEFWLNILSPDIVAIEKVER